MSTRHCQAYSEHMFSLLVAMVTHTQFNQSIHTCHALSRPVLLRGTHPSDYTTILLPFSTKEQASNTPSPQTQALSLFPRHRHLHSLDTGNFPRPRHIHSSPDPGIFTLPQTQHLNRRGVISAAPLTLGCWDRSPNS